MDGLLIIDKDKDLTSFKIVSMVKKIANQKR